MTTYKSKIVLKPQKVYATYTLFWLLIFKELKKKDYIIDFYVFEAIIQMANNTVLSIQGKDF